MIQRLVRLCAAAVTFMLVGCAKDRIHTMVVSIPEQKMALYKKGELLRTYDVSTSKFAISSVDGTNGTPLGKLEVATKIGGGQPSGMKFKNRIPTGEIVPVNAPGRDPIVSRILWLAGMEPGNRNTKSRFIYIHGTPEERNLGKPASYGCIRMSSRDVIELYDIVGTGAGIDIINSRLPMPPAPEIGPATQIAQNSTVQAATVAPSSTPANPAPAAQAH